jgi:hypothetical protein
MNPTLLLNASAFSAAADVVPASGSEDRGNNQLPLERDVAWQRALENAQEGDLAGMFSPWRPDTSAAMLGQDASGDAALRQTAVAMTVGLSSPSVAAGAVVLQPSGRPSAQWSPAPSADQPAPALPHSLDAHSQPYRQGLLPENAMARSAPAAPPESGSWSAPAAWSKRAAATPAPPVPHSLDSHSQPYAPILAPAAKIADGNDSAVHPEDGVAIDRSAATPATIPATGEQPGAVEVGNAVPAAPVTGQASVAPAQASANAVLAGALAAALQTALSVAVVPVSSATAMASIPTPGPARSAGLPMAGSDPVPAGEAPADDLLAGTALEEEPVETMLGTGGAPAAGYADRSAGSEPREPVRLYAEWSDQGVSVWLGADANQGLQVSDLVSQVQQWLAGQGERLLAVVCNGRVVQSDAGAKAEDEPSFGLGQGGGSDLPPAPGRLNISNRY